jgi:hypothetical protein
MTACTSATDTDFKQTVAKKKIKNKILDPKYTLLPCLA